MSVTGNMAPPSNTLSLMLSEYNSDEENEDTSKTNQEMVAKVDEFFQEINQTETTNWTECIDKATGHPYYWNIETKEVTWEQPHEYANFLKNHNHIATEQWTRYYTDDNVPYFVNEHTRRVLWEQPIDFKEPAATVKLKKRTKKDKQTKNKYKNMEKTDDMDKIKAKKNPFDEYVDDEKIELITSFEDKSDSGGSSDDDKSTNKQYEADHKIKLVAEYNSENEIEEDQENVADNNAQQRQLLSSITTENKAEHEINQTANPIEHCEIHNQSKLKTFASIITGGRSPQPQQQQPNKSLDPINSDIKSVETVECPTVVEMDSKLFQRKRRIEFITQSLPPMSTVQTADICMAIGIQNSEPNSEQIDMENNLSNDVIDTIQSNQSSQIKYPNFQRSHIEFDKDVKEMMMIVGDKLTDDQTIELGQQQKEEITGLRSIIEAKLKFLCDGRPEISAVQAILIQLETLLEAYDEQALHHSYIKKWLDNISSDLIALERDAAPPGWKCLWNRKRACYYYKNLTTGDIQWQYPAEIPIRKNENDDEMDICTTPPPPPSFTVTTAITSTTSVTLINHVDQQEFLGQPAAKRFRNELFNNADSKGDDMPLWAPPPPKISNEPLPPGIDASDLDGTNSTSTKLSETLNSELASFYSDLATIETITTSPTNDGGTEGAIAAPISTITDEKSTTTTTTITAATTSSDQQTIASLNENLNGKNTDEIDHHVSKPICDTTTKKKKKKLKKLEPWRSGNLETWIHQWKKAQKEL